MKQEPDYISESEISEMDELATTPPETKLETRDFARSSPLVTPRMKNSLGKLSYQLDPSFDLMDAYEVKNLFIRLREDCKMAKRPFTGRYMLFIDAVIELSSLTEICSLLNSRAVILRNILKKLEDRSPVWRSKVRSFRLNANN